MNKIKRGPVPQFGTAKINRGVALSRETWAFIRTLPGGSINDKIEKHFRKCKGFKK
jgi:hypothetical protein